MRSPRNTICHRSLKMTQSNTYTNRVAAALCALALSFLTITGTVATPSPAQASVAYVGVVA
jgi:hypothetical protein